MAYASTVGELTFNAFVVSLATTAAVHFGDVVDPSTGQPSKANLEAAGNAIEMLVLLEEKTRGNLTESESAFLQQVLYELRMRFTDAKRQNDQALEVSTGAVESERS